MAIFLIKYLRVMGDVRRVAVGGWSEANSNWITEAQHTTQEIQLIPETPCLADALSSLKLHRSLLELFDRPRRPWHSFLDHCQPPPF
ncbi:hypothetical protein BC936DRAFT_144954 [Jimgerdemannia flammicorona]|uniref:Uncharacterized protein n=2 Tax=Jimgerdemannia flammicorona TaxID=994334 RepID=A0A433QQS3_9FUNG|nr:hypothetical protein BC936DRAFT_144954 [Jimgerdemannia flammicorona]RUS32136.1 hypothetical protein BC938DRAFT_476218 [Jimgerdemannia flammicorona]